MVSPKQKDTIDKFNLPNNNHLIIRGKAGSAKTLLCMAVAKTMVAADDQILMIVTNGKFLGSLRVQLSSLWPNI